MVIMRKLISLYFTLLCALTVSAQTFSFDLDGRAYEFSAIKGKTWTDSKSGLKVECSSTHYPEFGVEEWMLRFTNTGKKNSPVISNLKILNLSEKKSDWKLYYSNGSLCTENDFLPFTSELSEPVHLQNEDGRSSSGHFPFFKVSSKDKSLIFAIGWTGHWSADISQSKNLQVEISAPYLDAYLEPGESIRAASVAMMTVAGDDPVYAQNRFKRFMSKHHSPQENGSLAHYPVSSSLDYGDPQPYSEYSALTEEYAIAIIHRYQFFDLLGDAFWIDAGWYRRSADWRDGYDWSSATGNWHYDENRFPRGLKPVGDAMHGTGSKFILWFEPERGWDGSDWVTGMPQYYIQMDGTENNLFNLANPEALHFLEKNISDQINEYGVDIYRQDYNINPDPFWTQEDKGRKGVTESHYIEGLYEYWDYLAANRSGLLIDNCASGGRRIDLETTTRSAPLWRSDWSGHPECNQNHTFMLCQWIPSSGTGVYDEDWYSCRSGYCSSMIFNWQITGYGDNRVKKKIMDEYKAIKTFYEKDFHGLTPDGNLRTMDSWVAYQLDDPEAGEGYVVAFRRPECAESTCLVKLGGLIPDAKYVFTNNDSGATFESTGKELASGLSLSLDNPRESMILKYRLSE